MKIHLIAAARPNFMKIAPLYHALKKEDWAEPVIVHTGQHYDLNMSDAFFQDLSLPEPHIHLGIGSGTHAEQTGKVMMAYEKVLLEHRPDLIIVVGDVNSTVACALAATKVTYDLPYHSPFSIHNSHGLRPLIAHLEAGLRSFDRSMPEEINRIVTDTLADMLWTPSPDGDENLLREGISCEKIVRVGNIMIDSLEMLRSRIEAQVVYQEYHLAKREYGLITLHRPSNVDNPEVLLSICDVLIKISEKVPLIFPVHPRTKKNLHQFRIMTKFEKAENILLSEPLSYVRFMNLVFNCKFAITDSGGIQEETTYLGIPCLTMRPNTERPITTKRGTNRLCNLSNLQSTVTKLLSQTQNAYNPPELWDGKTAARVVKAINICR